MALFIVFVVSPCCLNIFINDKNFFQLIEDTINRHQGQVIELIEVDLIDILKTFQYLLLFFFGGFLVFVDHRTIGRYSACRHIANFPKKLSRHHSLHHDNAHDQEGNNNDHLIRKGALFQEPAKWSPMWRFLAVRLICF